MEWINLKVSTIRQPEYVGSKPIQRSTWFNVLAYCIEQENGGRIKGAATWADRQWQQTCGVLAREVKGAPLLIIVETADVVVWNYPTEKEREVQAKREGGRLGGISSAKTRSQQNRSSASSIAQSSPEAETKLASKLKRTERKGKEGNGIGSGKEENAHHARAREINRTLPESLTEDPFLSTWPEWVSYLEERNNGRSVPSQTFDAHLRTCVKLGPVLGAQALRTAIARNLREPAVPNSKISDAGGTMEPFNPAIPNAHTGGAVEAV